MQIQRCARVVTPRWNGGTQACSVRVANSSSDAARERTLTKSRFCDCGGRLRYRDARRYPLPGIQQGHRWACESCGAVKTRWQAATAEERERERAQSRRASAKHRVCIRSLIEEAKNVPCADCGGRYPTCAMDLDHVQGAKEFKVSEAVQRCYGLVFERVRAEIAKCEVVCANCHRIRTEQSGYTARPKPCASPLSPPHAERQRRKS